jgi:hypothetical protein
MQLCLCERMTLGTWMFHDHWLQQQPLRFRVGALAAIIVAKPAGPQAGTVLPGLPVRKGHDNNRGG